MRATLLKILRRTLYTLLATLAILFAIVQFNQHLLRHRAEALHADILALQLHPGTFADLQRLQQKWGAHGRYTGTCTPASCRYLISLKHRFLREDMPDTTASRFAMRTLWLLGGRPVEIEALVLLHQNRMWRETYSIMVWGDYYGHGNPPTDRTCDDGCAIFAQIEAGPHLFRFNDNYFAKALQIGYKVGFEGACSGCVGANVNFTEQTSPADIRALTEINFSCMTRLLNCETEEELLPQAWRRHHNFEFRGPADPNTPFDKALMYDAPIAALGREAHNAVIIEILDRKEPEPDPSGRWGQGQVRILDRVKNGQNFDPGSTTHAEFEIDHIVGSKGKLPAIGERYIAIFRLPYGDLRTAIDWLAYIPDTPANRAEFLKGATLDLSGGEPDFQQPPDI